MNEPETRHDQALVQQNQNLKLQISKLLARLAVSSESAKKLTRLQNGMIDFLAELIDRNQNNSKDEIENQVRKEKRSKQLGHLLRQSNSDIMVLFYQLRTNVRIQLSFKEDYEMQLKSIIHQKQDALEDENKLLSNQLLQCQAQFEACNLRLQQELESARQMKDSMEISTRDKMERNSVEMENLKASWESTKAQFVQEAQSEKELLERQLKEKQQHVLKLEASLGEIQQSSRRDTVAFFQDPKKNRIQDKANAVDQKKQQFTNNKILAENERLKQHNQRLKQKIQGMYHNATFLQLSTMSKKMDQVNKNEQHLKSQIKDLHEQLREQKQQQAEQQRVKTNESMNTCQETIVQPQILRQRSVVVNPPSFSTSSIQQQQQPPPPQTTQQLANTNPHLIEHYREKLSESKSEIQKLKKNFHSMLASEHAYRRRIRVDSSELHRLSNDCDQLQQQLKHQTLALSSSSSSFRGVVAKLRPYSAQHIRRQSIHQLKQHKHL